MRIERAENALAPGTRDGGKIARESLEEAVAEPSEGLAFDVHRMNAERLGGMHVSGEGVAEFFHEKGIECASAADEERFNARGPATERIRDRAGRENRQRSRDVFGGKAACAEPFGEPTEVKGFAACRLRRGETEVVVRQKFAQEIRQKASFAGEGTSQMGRAFLKSYMGVCMEGAVIVLACLIFSAFTSSGNFGLVDAESSAVVQVLAYLAETIFNMLVLVGLIKGSDRIVKEMFAL